MNREHLSLGGKREATCPEVREHRKICAANERPGRVTVRQREINEWLGGQKHPQGLQLQLIQKEFA